MDSSCNGRDNESYDLKTRTGRNKVDWNSHRADDLNILIKKGSSFPTDSGDLSALIRNQNYSIVVGIQITNLTKYSLIDPHSRVIFGFSPQPAIRVSPGKMEAIIAHKRSFALSGTNGTVSWLIADKKKRIFVLWDCPIIGRSTVAVGFTTKGTEKFDESWYNTIAGGKQFKNLIYEYSLFHKESIELLLRWQ